MKLSTAAGIALTILLLTPGFTAAKTSGLSRGDSAVFSFEVLTTYRSGSGPNVTGTSYNRFSVSILSVNTSAPLGYLTYTLTLDVVNNSTKTTIQKFSNATTIFDPYDNYSYTGNIGFFPFTYTDLQPGRRNGLELRVAVNGVPGTSGTVPGGISHINTSVARTPGLIKVNYTLYNPKIRPMRTEMSFNATTGVLQRATTWANVFSVEKIFTYALLSFDHPTATELDLSFLWYVAVAGVVAFVVYTVVTRSSRQERKVARIRKKLKRPA